MEIKEFLEKQANGEYVLICTDRKEFDDWIEVPDGAELYVYWPLNKDKSFHLERSFFEDGVWTRSGWSVEEIKAGASGAEVLWQRHTQPESLPFIDDEVQHPSHYCSHPSGIECIEITRHHDFAIGNAIKYLWRAGLKNSDNEIQDLEKAVWYIQDKINQLKGL